MKVVFVILVLLLLTGCERTALPGGNMTTSNQTIQDRVKALSPEDRAAYEQMKRVVPILIDEAAQVEKNRQQKLVDAAEAVSKASRDAAANITRSTYEERTVAMNSVNAAVKALQDALQSENATVSTNEERTVIGAAREPLIDSVNANIKTLRDVRRFADNLTEQQTLAAAEEAAMIAVHKAMVKPLPKIIKPADNMGK